MYDCERTPLRALLNALMAVRDEAEQGMPDGRRQYGICTLVRDSVDRSPRGSGWELRTDVLILWSGRFRDGLFSSWKHFSGHLGYPVPATDWDLVQETVVADYCEGAAKDQYCRDTNRGNHWHGKQGELRLDLLNHCIKRVTCMLYPEDAQRVS